MTSEKFFIALEKFMKEECGEVPSDSRCKCFKDYNYEAKTYHGTYNATLGDYREAISWTNDDITRITLYKKIGISEVKLAEYRMEKGRIRYYLPKKNVTIYPPQDFDEFKSQFESALQTLKIKLPNKYKINRRVSEHGIQIFSISYDGKEVFCITLGERSRSYGIMLMKNQGYVELRVQGLTVRFSSKGPEKATPIWRDGGPKPSL